MRLQLITLIIMVLSLVGCGGSGEEDTISSSSSSGTSPGNPSSSSSSSSGAAGTATLAPWHYVLGINVGGGSYRDGDDKTFEADQYFSAADTNTQVVTGAIAGTDDQALYQSERWGDLTYEIPVGPGQYKVKLKFAELFWDVNDSRLIDVSVEGQSLAQNLDIHAQVGQFAVYEIETPALTVADGRLSISVTATKDNGTLSAIEVYADKNNMAVFSEADLADGLAIYEDSCAQCHGATGDGNGLFPSLLVADCPTCNSSAALTSVISMTMPLGGESCTGDCAKTVAGYIINTLNEGPTVGGECRVKHAPIRRLTRFEYNNTVEALLGDTTRPGNALPSEEIGNGFGNDANSLSVSSLLAEQYGKVAEGIANRVIDNPAQWQQLHACVQNLQSSTQRSCADQIIERLLPRAFRRTATATELDNFKSLQRSVAQSDDFEASIAVVIEAVLQSPEFLYRVEKGTFVDGRLKPTSFEMASRLSYFFWGSMPDDTLLEAAAADQLMTPAQIKAQAERMLTDQRSRAMIRYFFDAYLPISSLGQLERDSVEFPNFNSLVGSLMREETQSFLEHIIFDGPGDWASALNAPYTFMNETLAQFYGVNGVHGEQFQEVALDTTQRRGLLTQAGIMAGTTHSGHTNPVVRGAYVMKKLLCVDIPLPTGDILDQIKPPDPTSGATARERFGQHSQDAVCQTCHTKIDPVGLVFEHYDPVGLYRTHENGVMIDASGGLPGTDILVDNALELVTAIAEDPRTHQCFAFNWANFAYGKTLGASESCIKDTVTMKFSETAYDIQSLLVDLTQTDAFLYLPADHLQ